MVDGPINPGSALVKAHNTVLLIIQAASLLETPFKEPSIAMGLRNPCTLLFYFNFCFQGLLPTQLSPNWGCDASPPCCFQCSLDDFAVTHFRASIFHSDCSVITQSQDMSAWDGNSKGPSFHKMLHLLAL